MSECVVERTDPPVAEDMFFKESAAHHRHLLLLLVKYHLLLHREREHYDNIVHYDAVVRSL